MRTTPIPNPLPGPSPRIRSWRVSRGSHNAPRPPKPHNLSHEPLLQDTSSPWRNPFFLSDGSDNGDSGSFEMDEAAEAKNKGLCYRCTSGSINLYSSPPRL